MLYCLQGENCGFVNGLIVNMCFEKLLSFNGDNKAALLSCYKMLCFFQRG